MPKDLSGFFTFVNISESSDGKVMEFEKKLTEIPFDELLLNQKLDKKTVAVKHSQKDCLICCRKYVEPPNDITVEKSLISQSPEKNECETTMENKYWNFIIKHVKKIANPVWSKQSKHKLLDLKQRHPYSFQDMCLYSEVSKILGCFSFRPSARRFVQEIFYDLDFKSFYDICPGKNAKLNFDINQLSVLEKSMSFHDKSDSCFTQNEQQVTETLRNNDCKHLKEYSSPSESHKTVLTKPKFNTFELDLSCTKNIFPIRKRENEKTRSSNMK